MRSRVTPGLAAGGTAKGLGAGVTADSAPATEAEAAGAPIGSGRGVTARNEGSGLVPSVAPSTNPVTNGCGVAISWRSDLDPKAPLITRTTASTLPKTLRTADVSRHSRWWAG